MHSSYQYFAFISYNHYDIKWGKRLQRKLEGYRLPTTLCSEHGLERKPMKPIFFAPTDIQPGELNDELKSRLRASRNLVVICSPNSAKSEWVGQEIAYFASLGRQKNIYFFIVDGVPNSGDPATECYNPKIKELGLAGVLGSNINEHTFSLAYLNRERAYVQLITKLLGIEFDTLWQRHKRLVIEQVIISATLGVAALASVAVAWSANLPVDVSVKLNEITAHNDCLPQLQHGTVTLYLDNDIVTKEIAEESHTVVFPNVPKSHLGSEARLTFSADYFYSSDRDIILDRQVSLPIERDSQIYGKVTFRLRDIDMKKVAHCRVTIEGVDAMSNSEGYVELYVPLESQKQRYRIECDRELERDYIDLPCTGSEVIFTK